MPGKTIQTRGSTIANHASFIGASREVTFVTDRNTLRCHDGSTAGGFELAKSSYASISVAGSSNVALTQLQASNPFLEFTGILTGNIEVQFPITNNSGKLYLLKNSTTGSFTLTVIGTSGTGVVLPQSGVGLFSHDGTNMVAASGIGALGYFSDGSAGVPSISFNSDTDTGIFRSGANTLDFATGGSHRWSITSAGVLQSLSAQTITTSTGTLTLSSSAGNGNIQLTANGTGSVLGNSNGEAVFGFTRPTISVGSTYPSMFYVGKNSGGQLHVTSTSGGSVAIHNRWGVWDATTDNRWEWSATTTAGFGLIEFPVNGGGNKPIFFYAKDAASVTTGNAISPVLSFKVGETQIEVVPSTASSSTSTGSIINAGGLGNAGAGYFGGQLNANATTEATTGGAGSVVSLGGIYSTKAIISGSTTDSTSTTTGGAIFAGGVGIGKTLTTSARILTTAIKTTTYTILTTDHVIICNHASTAFTVTLPSLVSATTGRQYIIKNKGAAIVTVDANGSETIDGNLSVDLALYESITVVNDGTQWLIV